jgi:hypothetical protein
MIENSPSNIRVVRRIAFGPLVLGFYAEVSSGFLNRDLASLATDEPGEDVTRIGIEIGCYQGRGSSTPDGSRTISRRIGPAPCRYDATRRCRW